jgi:hypothetical protein
MKIASRLFGSIFIYSVGRHLEKKNNNTVTKEESVFELGQKCVSARTKMALGTD